MSPPRDTQNSDKDSQPGRALGPRFPQRLQGWQTAGGDGRKLGTTVRIVRAAPHRATGRGFLQPCPSDFGRTRPRGRVQRPTVPPPPLLPTPMPGVPLSTGPHGVSGVGRRGLGLVPLSNDKPSSGGSPPPRGRSLGPSRPISSPLSPPGSPSRRQSALPSTSDQGALPACCGSMFRGCSGRIECNLQENFQKAKGSNILLAAKGKQTQNTARNFLPGAVGRGAGVGVGAGGSLACTWGFLGRRTGCAANLPAPFIRPLHFADTGHLCPQGPGPSWGHRERRQNALPPPNHTAQHRHTSLPPSKPDGRAQPRPEGRRQRPRGKNGPETRQQVSEDTQPLKIPGRRKKDRIARDRTLVRVTTYLWGFLNRPR